MDVVGAIARDTFHFADTRHPRTASAGLHSLYARSHLLIILPRSVEASQMGVGGLPAEGASSIMRTRPSQVVFCVASDILHAARRVQDAALLKAHVGHGKRE